MVKVIDLFAGPGGLSEGFSSIKTKDGVPQFDPVLSIEKENYAFQTLRLRTFLRSFKGKVPEDYYRFLRKEIEINELFGLHPLESKSSIKKCWNRELGEKGFLLEEIRNYLNGCLGQNEPVVLIGGPPCQAYSVIGRSRNAGNVNYDPEKDERQLLYIEYLQILADHSPAVFVMENVRGLISAILKGERIFERILEDLKDPMLALKREGRKVLKNKAEAKYTIFSLVDGKPLEKVNKDHSIIKCELYGIPQKRHRVILLGIRNDLSIKNISTLKCQNEVDLKSLISDLPKLRCGLSRKMDSAYAWEEVIRSYQSYGFRNDSDLPKESAKLETFMRETSKKIKTPPDDRGAEFIPGNFVSGYKEKWFFDKKIGGICNHHSRSHMLSDIHRYFYAACYSEIYGISPKLKDFPPDLLPEHKSAKRDELTKAAFSDRFRVQLANRPGTTVVSHISHDGHYFIHYDPLQCRSLTVREVARIQTFPDSYFFCGPRTAQYIQVGNAVPPILAQQIAKLVTKILQNSGIIN